MDMSNFEEIAKAKAKIAKLMNMTVENGCSEDEQETAMAMAAGIATRLGIELSTVTAAGAEPTRRKASRKVFNQVWKDHQVLAFQAAGKLYGCDLYTYSGGKGGCYFIGRDENIELAEQTAFWLMRQVELLYKQNLPRGLSQSVRANYRKTFKAACAYRVLQRAQELMYEMRSNNDTAQRTTGSTALVVQDYFKTLAQENADYYKPTPEQEARYEQQRLERERREQERRNALTVAEREAEDKELERERKKAERAAARRKGPREKSIPWGVGSSAGLAAGDRVKLRREIG
jgi:hypothetical protein